MSDAKPSIAYIHTFVYHYALFILVLYLKLISKFKTLNSFVLKLKFPVPATSLGHRLHQPLVRATEH